MVEKFTKVEKIELDMDKSVHALVFVHEDLIKDEKSLLQKLQENSITKLSTHLVPTIEDVEYFLDLVSKRHDVLDVYNCIN